MTKALSIMKKLVFFVLMLGNILLAFSYCYAASDFNGDGKDDIVAFVRGTQIGDGQGDVYVALSTGGGFTGKGVKWHNWFCINKEIPAVGDFNGDGKDDIVTFLRNTQRGEVRGNVYVAISTGSGFSGQGVKWHDWFCINKEIPAVGDFNGDGKDDIVTFVRNTQAGDGRGDVYVAISTGNGFSQGGKWHDFFCISNEIPAVGDFNGDGKDDIITFLRNTQTGDGRGDVYVALSNGSGFSQGVKWHNWFCINNEIPDVGDFNGDGKDDIVTFVRNTQAGDGRGDVFVAISTGSSFSGQGVKWHDWFCINDEVPTTFAAVLPYQHFSPGPFNQLKPPEPPKSSKPPCYGNSLRLLTYNLAMLGTMQSNEDIFLMEDEERARIIADEILKDEYDIIVFQEAFTEEGKDGLVNRLMWTYPHYVYKLDASDLDQDSGLMLFSRYPFAPLPKDTYKCDDVTAISSSSPNSIWKDVAFLEYDSCQGDDCWANKGVGLVRIIVPCTKAYVNVAFTHTQASYGYDSSSDADNAVGIRRDQLSDVKKVLEGTLTAAQLEKEPVYLMGDLNINGNLFNMKPLPQSGKSEWTERFDSGEFFASRLKDGWAFQTSRDDPGQTTGSGFPHYPDGEKQGERLDYILYNPNAIIRRLPSRIQHISKAWELTDDSGEHYTDHFAVKADINVQAPYCNPLEALVVKPQPHQKVDGKITFPGSMQWYRIDESGSYSFKVNSDKVDFHVYVSDDLSRPIGNYHGEESKSLGLKFAMPKAPFYIRVFSSDRKWTGEYWISFHKHRGESPSDSIILRPAISDTYTMPPNPLNSQNAVWYDFHTDISDNKKYPQLQFILNQSEDIFTYQILNKDFDLISHFDNINVSRINQGFQLHMERNDIDAGKYYLKVLPKIVDPSGKIFTAEWRTNLSYVVAKKIKCHIQDDTLGDDTMWALINIDSDSVEGYYAYNLGDFDEGSLKAGITSRMGGVRKFVNNIWVELCEIDCFVDNHAWVTSYGMPHTSYINAEDAAGCGDDWFGRKYVYTLPPEHFESQLKSICWKDGDTYEYNLDLELARDSADIK